MAVLLSLLATPMASREPTFDPARLFPAERVALGVSVHGPEEESVARVASTVTQVLERADPRVAAGLTRQGAALHILANEEALETTPGLLDHLLQSRPLELIYTNIEGVDETAPAHRGTVAQKLMQLFVYYPLEQLPDFQDWKVELSNAFEAAVQPRPDIGQKPVYDPQDYSQYDEAHPHMKPPHFTAMGAYLGLGYEVWFGLTPYRRGETEYYPIDKEEMMDLDPALADFLDRTMAPNKYRP